MSSTDIDKVEERVERMRGGEIEINRKESGLEIATVDNLFRVARALAMSGVAVPPHCRDAPNTVFAICLQAHDWGLPYMAVLNKSYVTPGKGGERVAYEAQLVHTLIETRANLKNMLRTEYIGEGDEMICRVIGTFKGEDTPHTWDSEKLGKIKADIGYNERGQLKGSPLWITKPKLQLKYSTTRDWGRAHCPWVILGVYTPEEMTGHGDDEPVDVTPPPKKIDVYAQRLRDARAAHLNAEARMGFDVDHVEREANAHANNSINDDDVNPDTVEKQEQSDDKRRDGSDTLSEASGSGANSATRDHGGSAVAHSDVQGDEAIGTEGAHGAAGSDDAVPAGNKDPQGEIFPPDRKPEGKPQRRK